jgi:molybdopterin synthase catalytic subunit
MLNWENTMLPETIAYKAYVKLVDQLKREGLFLKSEFRLEGGEAKIFVSIKKEDISFNQR